MDENLIKSVLDLLKTGKGNGRRLFYILTLLEKDEPVLSADLMYVKFLLSNDSLEKTQ